MKPTLNRNSEIRNFQSPVLLLPPGSAFIMARVEKPAIQWGEREKKPTTTLPKG